MAIKPRDMAKMIDYTNLKPTATIEDIRNYCQDAVDNDFASVCFLPIYVPLANKLLKGTSVKVTTVIGFPLGGNDSETKSYETKNAIKNGAQEVDMVINLGAFKSEAYDIVKSDIFSVVNSTKTAGVTSDIIVKVIIETCYLDDNEIVRACKIVKDSGADFVMSSTFFGPDDVTAEDIGLMRKTVGREIGVKASGYNIQNFDDALAMLDAGANRIGAKAGVEIVTDRDE